MCAHTAACMGCSRLAPVSICPNDAIIIVTQACSQVVPRYDGTVHHPPPAPYACYMVAICSTGAFWKALEWHPQTRTGTLVKECSTWPLALAGGECCWHEHDWHGAEGAAVQPAGMQVTAPPSAVRLGMCLAWVHFQEVGMAHAAAPAAARMPSTHDS